MPTFSGKFQSSFFFNLGFSSLKGASFNVLLKKPHEGLSAFASPVSGSLYYRIKEIPFFCSSKMMMIKLWMVTCLQLAELFVSSVVHLIYGFYIFSTAVAGDVSQKLSDYLFKSNVGGETDQSQSNVEGLPPIVLVHGIFGFGKGVIIMHKKKLNFFFILFLLDSCGF